MMEAWRLNSKDKKATPIRRVFDPETSRPVVRQACNGCRRLKLRCSGEKSGCSRCTGLGRTCVYAEPGRRGRREFAVRHNAANYQTAADPPRQADLYTITPTSTASPSRRLDLQRSTQPSTTDEDNSMLQGTRLNPPYSNSAEGGGLGTEEDRRASDVVFDNVTAGSQRHDQALSPDDLEQWLVPSPNGLMGLFEIGPAAFSSDDVEMGLFDIDQAEHNSAGQEKRLCNDPSRPAGAVTSQDQLFPSCTAPTVASPTKPRHSPSCACRAQTDPSNGENMPAAPERSSDGSHSPSGTTEKGDQAQSCSNSDTKPLSDSNGCGHKQAECRCLQPVVFLVDEFDEEQDAAAGQGLDNRLASLKDAIGYCQTLLQCQRCRSRPDYLTILTFLTDKLVGLCEHIVGEYVQSRACAALSPRATAAADAKRLQLPVMLGWYEIDLAGEWYVVIGSLITVLLQKLYALLGRIKEVSEEMQLETVRRKSESAQKRIATLLRR